MLAPSRASRQAIARPIPRLAPEMKIVLSRNVMSSPSRLRASVVHNGVEVNRRRCRGVRACPSGQSLAGGRGIANRVGAHGYLRPADHQRAGARQRLCAGRARLHDGLRDHQPDQLRPRRGADGRRADELDGGHGARRLGPARLGAAADLPGRRGRRLLGAQLRDREDRLPAAAQRAAPGAAHHGDGHEPAPADAGDDHLEAELQVVPDPAAGRSAHRLRRGHQQRADPHPGLDRPSR